MVGISVGVGIDSTSRRRKWSGLQHKIEQPGLWNVRNFPVNPREVQNATRAAD